MSKLRLVFFVFLGKSDQVKHSFVFLLLQDMPPQLLDLQNSIEHAELRLGLEMV